MIKVAPSILAADFGRLHDEIQSVTEAGADLVHVDVMDGQFVPNISFGVPIIKAARKATNLPLDVHLMVTEPDRLIPGFIDAGADIVNVHVEAIHHIHRSIQLIRDLGAKPAVTLNPGTSAAMLDTVIDEVELILVMTVNPGYGGQAFIPSTVKKITHIATMIEKSGREIDLEVDGGVNRETVSAVVDAGANVLVAGTSVFGETDRKKAIDILKYPSV